MKLNTDADWAKLIEWLKENHKRIRIKKHQVILEPSHVRWVKFTEADEEL